MMAVEWGVWGMPTPDNPMSKGDPCNRARWMDWPRSQCGVIERTEANARAFAAALEKFAGQWWTFEARIVTSETC